MKIRLKPHTKNKYPLGAILIKGNSLRAWIEEVQKLGWTFDACKIYPIPNTTANSIWGSLLTHVNGLKGLETGKFERCQMLAPHIFIPEYTDLSPRITDTEIQQLFSDHVHILHPEFGWVELPEPLSLAQFITVGEASNTPTICPEDSVFIPTKIKSFQIMPLDPEEVMKNLEEKSIPGRKNLEDKPLDLLEKGKLSLYEMLFKKEESTEDPSEKKTEKTEFMKTIESFIGGGKNTETAWSENLQEDYEDLDRRNQKQIDKLMDLLKNNPEEALKYAIPLDSERSSRGPTYTGDLDWNLRWPDFSLFGNMIGQGTGGGIDLGDGFHRLEVQYRKTAKELTEKGDHKKAAFVYLKLLKDYYMAAQTLENGEYYEEAASIYLKHQNNKAKAAECYEKGNMIHKAIELYKELRNDEKVGDLYLHLHDREKADLYYQKVVDVFTNQAHYVKASLIARDKMNRPQKAQELLLEGWRAKKHPFNCLTAYFSGIPEAKELKKEIHAIYREEVDEKNRLTFLDVLKNEYKKQPDFSEEIKEIAYEILVDEIPTNASVVSNLRAFNKGDKELTKDMMRFRLKNK